AVLLSHDGRDGGGDAAGGDGDGDAWGQRVDGDRGDHADSDGRGGALCHPRGGPNGGGRGGHEEHRMMRTTTGSDLGLQASGMLSTKPPAKARCPKPIAGT